MKAMVEPVEIRRAEPDLIDRIANALPEEVRSEYYRELRHCRSLPENDEMLRLLRAMQFLVLLIEQAPGRVAEERGRLEKLLTATVENVARMSAASEAYHFALERKLSALPSDIASGISPGAVAEKINENLRQEFLRSTIPLTAHALAATAERIKKVNSEFSAASDTLGNTYRGAAEDARQAVASLKSEISQAAETAARFTSEVAKKFSMAYHWMLFLFTGGSLVIGLAMGMMLERWLYSPPGPVPATAAMAPPAPAVTPAAAVTSKDTTRPAPQSPALSKAVDKK